MQLSDFLNPAVEANHKDFTEEKLEKHVYLIWV